MNIEEFNKRFVGTLVIKTTKPNKKIAPGTLLLNERASADSAIVSVKLDPEVYEDDDDIDKCFRKPTKDELDEVVIEESTITLRSLGGETSHNAPNGKHFTVRDLFKAIEETERQTRGQTEWFGGIDIHHVYYEGVKRVHGSKVENLYEVGWGS